MTDRWQITLQLGGTKNEQDGMAGRLRFSMQLDSSLWLAKWQNVHDLPVSGTPLDHASLLWGLEYQEQHGESDATRRQLDKRLVSPTIGLSWDIGWAGRLTASSKLQLNYYRQHYRDMILFQTNPLTGGSSAGNMADAVVRDFDAELR